MMPNETLPVAFGLVDGTWHPEWGYTKQGTALISRTFRKDSDLPRKDFKKVRKIALCHALSWGKSAAANFQRRRIGDSLNIRQLVSSVPTNPSAVSIEELGAVDAQHS
jgi:hypothetical protein